MEASIASVQEGSKEEDALEETPEAGAETTMEDGTGEVVTTGGRPWIDSEIKENISADTVVSPKDDFHLYANKQWLLSNDIPDGYTSWSHYSECYLTVKKECMDLLKDETIEGNDAEVVRTYNKLLLDWDSRNKAGYTRIKDRYEKALNAKNIDDITALITDKAMPYEFFNFISVYSYVDYDDPTMYLVEVGNPEVLLKDSAEYSKRSELGDIYYNIKKEMFEYMSGRLGMSSQDADKYFEAAIALEGKLATKIYTTQEKNSDDYVSRTNNVMNFDELTLLSSAFPLGDLLAATGYKYDGKYRVLRPEYFTVLDEVYTDDNIEGIKGIILVNYLYDYARFLDRETYEKLTALKNKYYGASGALSDEEYAYDIVTEYLPPSMQKVYVAQYGSEEDKKKMEDLCRQVIATYREMLTENTWASKEVKQRAIEKLNSIWINAAYPDKFRDTSNLNIEGLSLVESKDYIVVKNIEFNKSLMGQKVDKDMWAEDIDILECNAFYDTSANTINMNIGMMREPFYSTDMSTEELYASIGAFWVGHEISHAFDNYGSQYDSEGKLRDWWPEADKAEFKRRIKKMDDYLDTIVAFGDYHFIGSNVDTEMVADMTGLQCALKMASKLEKFDYDKFFTKYAQMNCSLGLYSEQVYYLLQEEHPLDYSRTNVPVQQFEEFYETYDVKEGDNMYLAPEDRVVVW